MVDYVVQNDILYNIEIKKNPIQKFKKLILGLLYIKYKYIHIYMYIYYVIFFLLSNSLSMKLHFSILCYYELKEIEIEIKLLYS